MADEDYIFNDYSDNSGGGGNPGQGYYSDALMPNGSTVDWTHIRDLYGSVDAGGGSGNLPINKYNSPYTSYPSTYPNMGTDSELWDANVGKGSTITGGQRTVGGGGGTSRGGTTQGGYGDTGVMPAYTPSALPTLPSTYVAPDESKIASLTMSGGGNALRSTIGNLINRNLASSAALPLAVRNAQLRNISENIAEAYAKSMPNIRKTAANEWMSLYGAPQQAALQQENQNAMQAYILGERGRQAEYEARLRSALPIPVAGGGSSYSYNNSYGAGGGGGAMRI